MACAPLDFACAGREIVSQATADGLKQLANATTEAVGGITASLGTFWANVPTPNLTGGGSGDSGLANTAPPLSENVLTLLNWTMWISIIIAIISLMLAWVAFGMRRREAEASRSAGKIGVILLAVVGISAASALVAALLPNAAASNASGPVAFVQNSLWWYTGALAVLSIIIGGARMIIQQRAEPAKDTLKSLLTLLLVSTAGVLAIGMLTTAMDALSVWILRNSTAGCDVTSATDTCFGENIAVMLAFAGGGALGTLAVIILGAIAMLFGYVQLILMVIRGGMLVLLTGIFPISASITNTEVGQAWFKKLIGWLLAFILYKPAAAIVYAVAFQLTGTNAFKDDGTGLLAILTGLALMAMALIALPALMKFIAPMVAQTGGSGGMAAMAMAGAGGGALGDLATGAARRGGGGSGSGGGGGEGPGKSSESSASGNAAASGGKSSGGSAGGAPGAAKAGGAAAGGGGAAAGGGGAAAGGGAASGAAAAAGPVGIGVMAAQMVASKASEAGKAASGAAAAAAEDTTGSGS